MQSLVAKFKTNLEKSMDINRTRADLTRKNASFIELRKSAGDFITLHLSLNPAMTSELRTHLGLKPLQQTRSKPAIPDRKPLLGASSEVRKITAYYRNAENGKKSKPKGVRSILYRWDIADEQPDSPEQLSNMISKSSGPLVLEFKESDRGKTIFVSACWENSIGQLGPWSDILKIYIT
jgi:hypothetical protein